MRYIGLGLALVVVMLPGAASAQSVFDGQWRIDLGKVQLPTRAWVVELGKDSYRCASCTKP